MTSKIKLLTAGAVLAIGAVVPAIAQAGGDSETQIPDTDIDRASVAAIAHLGGGQVTDTEIGDEESYYEVEVARDDGRQVDVQLDQNLNVVGSEEEVGTEDEASTDDEIGTDDDGAETEESEGDSEAPIPAPDIERASAAAIEHLGGGRVTGTEVGDEESYYEVEVTLEDGRLVDVQLDENFNVVGTEDDGTEDEESPGG
jgi:uncharacterized membrane protein YkoI